MPKQRFATGPYPHTSPAEVAALRAQYGLTKAEFAQLARVAIQRKKNGSSTSSTVDKWEQSPFMATATHELVLSKLALVDLGLASIAEVLGLSLPEIILQVLQRQRRKLAKRNRTK